MVPSLFLFRGILFRGRISGGTQTDMGPIRTVGGFGWILLISSLLVLLSPNNTLPQEPAPTHPPAPKPHSNSTRKKAPDTFTLVGAGDIVGCSDLSSAEAT